MLERARLERSVYRAEGAFKMLAKASDVSAQQAAWEDFVSQWRTALNQVATTAKRSSLSLANDMHTEREDDPLLDYVWEARNAEEHTPDGTSEPALRLVPKPLTYSGMPITYHGQPVTISINEMVLQFRPLTRRRVVLQPPSTDVAEVAKEALGFLLRSYENLRTLTGGWTRPPRQAL